MSNVFFFRLNYSPTLGKIVQTLCEIGINLLILVSNWTQFCITLAKIMNKYIFSQNYIEFLSNLSKFDEILGQIFLNFVFLNQNSLNWHYFS